MYTSICGYLWVRTLVLVVVRKVRTLVPVAVLKIRTHPLAVAEGVKKEDPPVVVLKKSVLVRGVAQVVFGAPSPCLLMVEALPVKILVNLVDAAENPAEHGKDHVAANCKVNQTDLQHQRYYHRPMDYCCRLEPYP